MPPSFQFHDMTVEVVLKKMRHIRLRLLPPGDRARVSAPRRATLEGVRLFVISKGAWLEKQRAKWKERFEHLQEEDSAYAYVWGERYALKRVERAGRPLVQVREGELWLPLRAEEDEGKKRLLLDRFYRDALQEKIPALIEAWEPVLGVKVSGFSLRKMKTRWGSCAPARRHIRLNTELARRAPECLEYVLVHEMVHLLEASHQPRFYRLMDRFLPNWRATKKELNRFPLWR